MSRMCETHVCRILVHWYIIHVTLAKKVVPDLCQKKGSVFRVVECFLDRELIWPLWRSLRRNTCKSLEIFFFLPFIFQILWSDNPKLPVLKPSTTRKSDPFFWHKFRYGRPFWRASCVIENNILLATGPSAVYRHSTHRPGSHAYNTE